MAPAPPAPSLSALADAADRCVKCGLCLPHCPTYVVTQVESESPRGRIALAEALAAGAAPSAGMARRLDSCLGCRSCETVCPARVDYAQIIDAARALVAPARPAQPLLTLTTRCLRIPALRRTLAALLAAPGVLRLLAAFRRRLGRRLPALQRTLRLLPAARRSRPAARPVAAPAVHLFEPCASQLADPQTADDAREVLRHLGVEATTAANRGCCGALAWHAGERAAAIEDQARLLAQYRGDDLPIVCTGSGCSLMLREQAGVSPRLESLARRSQDLCEWLDRHASGLQLSPLPEPVVLHVPCSLRNGLQQTRSLRRLLQRIPQLRLIESHDRGQCCGAGGDNLLRNPDTADALAAPHLDTVEACGARWLLSANVGCALHLRAAAEARGLRLTVAHPVSLIRHLLV